MVGVLVLMLGNMVMSMFGSHDGGPLRNGGTLAIIFSLVCIALAAFSFLIDFDAADQMIARRTREGRLGHRPRTHGHARVALPGDAASAPATSSSDSTT